MGEVKNELAKIVGAGNIFDDLEILEVYSKDRSFVPPRKPRLVVKPKNADEVQKIVRWANQVSTPLVPVSSGPPHFNGDTVPSATGAVIVDLSRMKRIIRINRRNRMAMIEPGVTYSELLPELAKEGLKLSTPLLPRANKSVIASLLERQPTLPPKYQWTLLEPLRCLEVVWGDGNKLMTGEAGSNSLEAQWGKKQAQAMPTGPGQVDFFRILSAAQGSMGIATWASVKCEVLPRIHKLFFVPAERLDDLLDFTYKLLRFRFGDELFLLNGMNLASILGEKAEQIRALRGKLPKWVVIVGVAGRDRLPEERVEFQEKDITDIARQFGLKIEPAIARVRDKQLLETIINPSKEPYWKLRYKGECQDIFFLTTLNKAPEFIRTAHTVAESSGYPCSAIGIYLQPQHQGVSCHCEFSLPFASNNLEEATNIREIYTKASEELLKQGAFFSRPYGIWADMAYNQDAQTTIVLKKVKEIFDPNNVMNPGKLCF